MDYDIVDGTRPRLQLQSGGGQGGVGLDEDEGTKSGSKVQAGICASVGFVSLGLALSVLAGPLQFVAIWFGLSLVLGPFAPLSVTGGDCRVGVGESVLPEVDADDSVEQIGGGVKKQQYNSREKHAPRQVVEVVSGSAGGLGFSPAPNAHNCGRSSAKVASSQTERGSSDSLAEEGEWGVEDVDLLRKLIVKHPRGTLRRWEVIADALGDKYNVDSVVKMSKALGQKKVGGIGDQDAYSRFLSQRKVADVSIASPLSRRDDIRDEPQQNGEDVTAVLTAEDSDEPVSVIGGGKGKWTEVEDKALLTALKTFPKDSPMRWDKVALALPGRSKAQCFRRFSDLRKNFRSTVGGGSASQDDLIKD